MRQFHMNYEIISPFLFKLLEIDAQIFTYDAINWFTDVPFIGTYDKRKFYPQVSGLRIYVVYISTVMTYQLQNCVRFFLLFHSKTHTLCVPRLVPMHHFLFTFHFENGKKMRRKYQIKLNTFAYEALTQYNSLMGMMDADSFNGNQNETVKNEKEKERIKKNEI